MEELSFAALGFLLLKATDMWKMVEERRWADIRRQTVVFVAAIGLMLLIGLMPEAKSFFPIWGTTVTELSVAGKILAGLMAGATGSFVADLRKSHLLRSAAMTTQAQALPAVAHEAAAGAATAVVEAQNGDPAKKPAAKKAPAKKRP